MINNKAYSRYSTDASFDFIKYLKIKIAEFIPVFLILYIAYCGFVYVNAYMAAGKIHTFENQEFMRIMLYGTSSSETGDTVSATFSIIDSNRNEIAKIERSWSGSYLAAGFRHVKIRGKDFYFPAYIYSRKQIYGQNTRQKRLTNLKKYYDENGQCMLLGFGSTLVQRRALFDISNVAHGNYFVPFPGTVYNLQIDLSGCQNGVYYSICVNSQGKLELQKL